ncbi:hypothetical protein HG535_0G01670 [Zygotorulaspora mrakii]|uniref:Stress response RCI peptide n=1 Tax=Zygotorulaspora mrakii TaxID=42260 RepID=A0A7H9B701_ZYGMR|nr:uncharacterized protein HG535_0G01670 [Zygotorulaspora mrakii]QLG74283.1 hypothetical protein HG535_0G01670 [Zygotorulaspora mrakii]
MCLYCCCTVSDLILYIIAFFLPPVAVIFRSGLCSSDLLLNVLLTLLGVVPGMLHAFYYITVTSPLRRDEEYAFYYQRGWADSERQAGASHRRQHNQSATASRNEGYGSIQPPQIQAPTSMDNGNSSSNDKNGHSNAPPPYSEIP